LAATAWLERFLRSLPGKNEAHRSEVERLNRTFIEDSGAQNTADLDGSAAEEWLLTYGQEHGKSGDISARTSARYAQHLKQFGRYLVKHKKRSGVTENPFELLSFSASEADRVYLRRHITEAELTALLKSAPDYRSLVYLAASLTGLRRKELGSLAWEDVGEGWLRLHAKKVKNKKARLRHPIPSSLVILLGDLRKGAIPLTDRKGRPIPQYLGQGTGPKAAVFPCIPGCETLRRDLTAAKVSYKTADGVIDFHSLRGAFACLLEAHGVGLSTGQKLMRHSDPRLTANVYQRLQYDELTLALGAIEDTATRLATVVKTVVDHRQSPTTMSTYEDTSEEHSEASNRRKYVAGPTRNRNERPCCSHGPAILSSA
jgi:integrase